VTEFATISAENRELRERVAASASRPNKYVETLKALPRDTPIQGKWRYLNGPGFNGEFLFVGVDEAAGIIKLHPDGRRDTVRQLPLEKIDIVYPLDEKTWCLVMHPFM
jgi:hypothetical protein